MKDETKQAVGIACVAIFAVFLIYMMFGRSDKTTTTASYSPLYGTSNASAPETSSWEARDKEAVALVQDYKPHKRKLVDALMKMLAVDIAKGAFVKDAGWYALYYQDSTYKVYFSVKDRDKEFEAIWSVDIATKAITPDNQTAYTIVEQLQ